LDSINARADDAGLQVLITQEGFDDFPNLMRAPTHQRLTLEDGLADRPERREIWWVYFEDVDAVGHRQGADASDYKAAALRADARLGRLMAALDPIRDALVVVSDHGHLGTGGHGGSEPEVLRAVFSAWGGPFGTHVLLPPAPMRDLAPTLAAALGIEPPKQSMGTPMLDALGMGPPQDNTHALRQDAKDDAHFESAARVRLAVVSALWALLLMVVIALHRRRVVRLKWRDLWPTLIYTSIYCGVYILLGYRWSWSIGQGRVVFVIETALGALLALLVALKLADRERRAEEALVMGLILGTPYMLNSAWAGLDMRDIAGPWASFGMVFWATLNFYCCIAFGIRALLDARGPREEPPLPNASSG
jgi:hypothetical protein